PFTQLLPQLWGFAELNILVFAMIGIFLGRLYDADGLWVLALYIPSILIARHAYAAYLSVQDARNAALDVLVECLEVKDPYTAGHVRRVALFADYIGEQLRLTPAT